MSTIDNILRQMRSNTKGIRFAELSRVCEHFFGPARQSRTSHRVFRTPWAGDPRVNIQADKGMAKPYQVRQVLKAIKRMEDETDHT